MVLYASAEKGTNIKIRRIHALLCERPKKISTFARLSSVGRPTRVCSSVFIATNCPIAGPSVYYISYTQLSGFRCSDAHGARANTHISRIVHNLLFSSTISVYTHFVLSQLSSSSSLFWESAVSTIKDYTGIVIGRVGSRQAPTNCSILFHELEMFQTFLCVLLTTTHFSTYIRFRVWRTKWQIAMFGDAWPMVLISWITN